MKKLSFVLAFAFTATVTAAVLADGDKDAATLYQISGYRDWTRVSPDPVEVSVPVARSGGEIILNPTVLT